MKYYKGNALYDLIAATQNFRFAVGDLWMLVYGDRQCTPKLILLLSGVSDEEYIKDKPLYKEEEMLVFVRQLSDKASVPYLHVRFNKETSKLTQVKIREENGDFKTISTQEYTNMVLGYGIKLKEGACSKPINDKYSNVYHIWQNQSGLDIVTSDIDLMRVNSEQEITDVYELKRSWITIEDWRPFKQDYNNFILLSTLFKNCNIDFYIVYNVFKKEEGYEELSKLKLFKVNYSENLEIECKGIVEVSNFLLG